MSYTCTLRVSFNSDLFWGGVVKWDLLAEILWSAYFLLSHLSCELRSQLSET